MTSRKIENVHQELLDKILQDSGLECTRSTFQTPESSVSSGVSEEQIEHEEPPPPSPEAVVEEEPKAPIQEEKPVPLPEIFPTPSLRYALPDKVRAIEKQNRINVLPETFKKFIDPQAIPKIAYTPPQLYIDILAELVGCKNYKSSLAEFWFLDTMANLLRRAQEEEMDRPTQAVLMIWFCEWMKEMQYFDAADRQRMMRRFQDNMLAAGKVLADVDHIPTPAEAGVYYKSQDDSDARDRFATMSQTSKHMAVSFGAGGYECSVRDLTKIIHYIFDLFSTDYQYNLVRSVFTFTPEYTLIDAPYQIQNPKRLFVVPKAKAKKERSPKSKDKPGKKKKEIETEEYLALMELKARDEKELEEQEERDKEAWIRKSSILPLVFAATDEFYNKYWPPPAPEPEPIHTPDMKSGKGKGKK